MTAATLTHLPLAAGSAMLASTGRVALWALSRYMRAPLTHTGLLLLVGMSAMAGSNALYLQEAEHPSPLFVASAPAIDRPFPVAPVVPAARLPRPEATALPQLVETTGSLPAAEAPTIGNAEVFELQRKLAMMNLFDGKIDGYYGPQTAGAIRKFEERAGLPATGELTPDILAAVRDAKPFAAAPLETTPAAVSPPAQRLAPAAAAPASTPLPTPAPLPEAVQPLAAATPVTKRQAAPTLRRELPATPQEAMNIAVDTAGDAIDTIIEGVQTVTMNRPPAQPAAQRLLSEPSAASLPARQTASQPSSPATQVAMTTATAAPAREETAEAAPAELPELDTDAKPEDLMPPFSVTDPTTVASVQRGLASLGFLHGPADGVAGEATAKAIRNFEVYFNYKVTGRISPELLDLLVRNGASI